MYKILLLLALFTTLSCQSKQEQKTTVNPEVSESNTTKKTNETPKPTDFKSYWYSGKAEISSYTLKQSKYGTIRDGEVVLIFVTEPFSLSKQVKLDRPQTAGADQVSVMKLNHVRKFTTGIYDYSILTSTFTPIDYKSHPFTLKSTTSIQEWCGQTFTQLNLDGEKYNFKQFSYFESEGDDTRELAVALLEEDLMTRIRIQNGQLEAGEIAIIPSTIYSRSSHKKMNASKATISKTETQELIKYTVTYLNLDRTLTFDVENQFPYKIMGWTEDNGDGLVTTATLKASLQEPYWKQKSIADEAKRDELKLKH
ncbi:hypothetical protein [Formosa algae]|uniref:Septum formation inhibitor Maf n=1 Tax=Formosa algae TaxID=225843 RepID=A0A9X0YKX1_9FLAO|nr:hypothetical protein [Formosa algae]MBP1840667.1 hypothetical protein [Formosa algae]MDQ0335920.1 hypothetical protein [Formosa algae]OEI81183.1 hypothetical protein AST99_05865 [Formosa algae]